MMRAWQAPTNNEILRLLFHDVPLATEYAIHLDREFIVEPGFWDALRPLLCGNVDYIGQPQWKPYLPAELELIRGKPWHLGVPFERRAGHAGVTFMRKGLIAVRCERLREANYPESRMAGTICAQGEEFLLGEIARQLGWTRAEYPTGAKA
jgi:hypothetical protein